MCRGLSVADFAALVGRSKPAVYQWESGAMEPTHDTLAVIAQAVGVSMSRFWGAVPAPKRKSA